MLQTTKKKKKIMILERDDLVSRGFFCHEEKLINECKVQVQLQQAMIQYNRNHNKNNDITFNI